MGLLLLLLLLRRTRRMETDILARSVAQSSIPPQSPVRRPEESEDDLLNELRYFAPTPSSALSRTVPPIQIRLAPAPVKVPVKAKRVRKKAVSSARVVKDLKVVQEATTKDSKSSPTSARSSRLNEAGTRRLPLQEALEAADVLLEELRGSQACKIEKTIDVLRELTLKRIMLEKLSQELTSRNVLPVTLNTLSNLFSGVYTRIL